MNINDVRALARVGVRDEVALFDFLVSSLPVDSVRKIKKAAAQAVLNDPDLFCDPDFRPSGPQGVSRNGAAADSCPNGSYKFPGAA
jgi:hypothetical protein